MNKSEIAERAAREIHGDCVLCEIFEGVAPDCKPQVDQDAAIVERAIAESQAPGLCEKKSPFHSPTSMFCIQCLPPDAPLGALLLSNREPTADEVKRGLEIARLLDERRKAQGLPPKFVTRELGDGEPSPQTHLHELDDSNLTHCVICGKDLRSGAVQEVSPREPTKLITTQAQEEARIFKEDNIKMYSELERAEAEVRELREALAKILPRVAHQVGCVKCLPTEQWTKETGNWVVDKCVCGIAAAESVLARERH